MPPYAVPASSSSDSLVDHDGPSFCDNTPIKGSQDEDHGLQESSSHQRLPQHETRSVKCVSFSPKVYIRPIDNREDIKRKVYTNNIWYHRSEYQAFRMECQNTVQRMAYYSSVRYPPTARISMPCYKKNHSSYLEYDPEDKHHNPTISVHKDEWCLRGLEQFITGSACSAKMQAALAVQAVITEQELQRYEGIDDKDCLADVYYEKSVSCQLEARQQGLRDRQEVLELEWKDDQVPRLISELAFVI